MLVFPENEEPAMNAATASEVANPSVFDSDIIRKQLGSRIMPRTPAKDDSPATRGVVKMNPLQRLIRKRMVDLDRTYREVADKGGLPYSTVFALASKSEHKQVPRLSTLEKLAKGLDVPVDMIRDAAAETVGFHTQEISVPLRMADDVRIIVAAAGKLSPADVVKLRRLAEAFVEEIDAEADADEK